MQMDAKLDLTTFPTVLGETIAWCSERVSLASPANSLRSSELQPPPGDELWLVETQIQSVIARRRRLLPARYSSPARSLAGGRLLVYEPGGNLCDGAAPLASDDFFDVDNTPPWDTWLGYICYIYGKGIWQHPGGPQLHLLSWIPPAYLALADDGIQANPEQCIRWAVDEEHEFFRELQGVGLLA
jgi:hypothetical protein